MKIGWLLLAASVWVGGLAACAQTQEEAAPPSGGESVEVEALSVGGAPVEEETAVYTAKIVSIKDGLAMLAGIGENDGESQVSRISIKDLPLLDSQGEPMKEADLKAGSLVEITFDGMIMETYPLQLGGVASLKVIGEEPDIAGLYLKMLDDLWNKDPGLNEGVTLLSFDLTKVSNMSPQEKAAFCWKAAENYQCQRMMLTFDELCEEGYVDEEALYFPDGLLITIEDTPIKGDSFTFHAQKWRGGLGAYFFHNCRAEKDSGTAWDYTIGAEMIS